MTAKPTILVTNDDGINAPGIRALISVMTEIGNVIGLLPIVRKAPWDMQSLSITLFI